MCVGLFVVSCVCPRRWCVVLWIVFAHPFLFRSVFCLLWSLRAKRVQASWEPCGLVGVGGPGCTLGGWGLEDDRVISQCGVRKMVKCVLCSPVAGQVDKKKKILWSRCRVL